MFGAEAEGRQRVYLHKNLHIHLAACIFFDVEWFSPHGGTVHLHEINYVFLHLVVGFFFSPFLFCLFIRLPVVHMKKVNYVSNDNSNTSNGKKKEKNANETMLSMTVSQSVTIIVLCLLLFSMNALFYSFIKSQSI